MDQIGRSLKQSQPYLPTCFGESIPDLVLERTEYQASTWFTYSQIILHLQLMHHLPSDHKAPWSRFLWCLYKMHQYQISVNDLNTFRVCMADFMAYLEM